MSESWKSKGHYLKDGTEWKGDQHATRGCKSIKSLIIFA